MYLPISKISTSFDIEVPTNQAITSVCTDSRDAKRGSIFVGMQGSRMDGSIFAKNALDLGATLAFVENIPNDLIGNQRVIKVDNGRLAMLKLGELVRQPYNIPFVAVTGSVGKTTTKDFIACVLSKKYRTHKNIESKNDEIGVPSTIFNINEYHQAVVLEFGMDHFGDIKILSDIVKPNIGVITQIGYSHIGNIGSKEKILEGKLQLVSGMKENSPLILNADDELLSKYVNHKYDICTFGVENKNALAYATHLKQIDNNTEFDIVYKNISYHTSIAALGEHIVRDAVAAFLVGVNMDVSPKESAEALKEYAPMGMRQHITNKHGLTIIEDCYNSSPESLIASAKAFKNMNTPSRKILVVSDMLELGNESVKQHVLCGEYIGKQNFDSVFAFGKFSKELINSVEKNGTSRTYYSETIQELINSLKKYIKPQDTLWFKASHAQHLEEAVFAL